MEDAVSSYNKKGLHCVIARPFNHIGPGQMPGFLLPDLAQQLENAKNENGVIRVGNIKTRRDFTDVRDVARAYTLLATTESHNLSATIYNICSGTSLAGEQILGWLSDAYGFNDIKVEVDTDKIRENDVMDIYGSNERLQKDTGWKPQIPIEQTIRDFVEWKRSL